MYCMPQRSQRNHCQEFPRLALFFSTVEPVTLWAGGITFIAGSWSSSRTDLILIGTMATIGEVLRPYARDIVRVDELASQISRPVVSVKQVQQEVQLAAEVVGEGSSDGRNSDVAMLRPALTFRSSSSAHCTASARVSNPRQ